MKLSEEALEKRRQKFYKSKLGLQVGNFTILKYEGVDKSQKHLFEVKCFCGNKKTLRWNNIRDHGGTSSCGCLKAKSIKERMGKGIKHLCAQSIKTVAIQYVDKEILNLI